MKRFEINAKRSYVVENVL